MAMVFEASKVMTNTMEKEWKTYSGGERSLRTYRRDMPMPSPVQILRNWHLTPDGQNYTFEIFGVPMRTHFGLDFSNNKDMMDRARSGEYKLCDSSIQIKGKKLFLLAVFEFEKQPVVLDEAKKMQARLGVETPIECSVGNKTFKIGTKEEFLHRRIQIQCQLRNSQMSSRFNKNGKGRTKKMKSTERYHELEHNYVKSRMHAYSRKLIDLCVSY